MAVLRTAHKTSFTVIDNGVFKSHLSLKARGLLCTMLSLPDNWHFTELGLVALLPKDGRGSLRSTLRELEEEQYLTRTRVREEDGTLADAIWTFSDYPQAEEAEEPTVEKPMSENPTLDKSMLETNTRLNKEVSSTNESSNHGASKERSASAQNVDSRNPKKAPKASDMKRHYGEYDNVLLTDTDLSKLQEKFPDWKERIERLSAYMQSKGRHYRDHRATIETWARNDAKKQQGSSATATTSTKVTYPTAEELMKTHNVDFLTAQEMLFAGKY